MPKPNSPPSYDGEVFLAHRECTLVDDDLSNPLVDLHVEVYQAMNLPSDAGLEWVRRAGWIQIPVEQLWMFSSEDAQVPLRILGLTEDDYDQPNKNFDSFEVGKLETWEPAKSYQHVDKSVPERRYQIDYSKMTPEKKGQCHHCGQVDPPIHSEVKGTTTLLFCSKCDACLDERNE